MVGQNQSKNKAICRFCVLAGQDKGGQENPHSEVTIGVIFTFYTSQ